MDEAEQKEYVCQLRQEFGQCDSSGSGYLDRDGLTDLCQSLHLDTQLPVLLQTLLGSSPHTRVNFEEFKEGFVAVLSAGIDLSTSEDDSSYFKPDKYSFQHRVNEHHSAFINPQEILQEVEPRLVRGGKRYGRRSVPEPPDAEAEASGDLEELFHLQTEPSAQIAEGCPLRLSTSLESVESLKSDEELELCQESPLETFEARGQLGSGRHGGFGCRWSDSGAEATEGHVQALWEELGVGQSGYLHREELVTVCNNIGLGYLSDQEVDSLFRKLDNDGDERVSHREFLQGLLRHGASASTPMKCRLLAAVPGLAPSCSQLFSPLDDGSGYTSTEQIINMWQKGGIKNSREILQALDFSVEEKVGLAELTAALENEMMCSRNGIHRAALTSYRNEIDHLQGHVQQVQGERDKLQVDLERAEKRNAQLGKEVDDRQTAMELLNETKIRHLDQGYREKLVAVRVQMDKAQELMVQQVTQLRKELEEDLESVRSEETSSREKLTLTMKENKRLQRELMEMVEKLAESEKLIIRLQTDLDYMLKDKLGVVDNSHIELFGQEDRFAEIILAYEQKCRELRDQNDELRSEVEVLRSAQLQVRKLRPAVGHHKSSDCGPGTEQLSGNTLHPDKELPKEWCGNVSIEMEIAMEQQRVQWLQEVQDLRRQLETKVNYYEREMELMKRNFEKERRIEEERFKLEMSKLEEEKLVGSREVEQLQGVVSQLRAHRPGAETGREERAEDARVGVGEEGKEAGGSAGQGERKAASRTWALEEVSERKGGEWQRSLALEGLQLQLKLSQEKLQQQRELRLTHQQELQRVRYECEILAEENSSLKRKVAMFRQDFRDQEGKVNGQRKQVAWLEDERENSQKEFKELQNQNEEYMTEIAQLNGKNLQLTNQNSQWCVRMEAGQSTVQLLNKRLAQLGQQKEETARVCRQLQEACSNSEKEHFQQQSTWERERGLVQKELQESQEKIQNLELSLERSCSEVDHLKLELLEKQQDNFSLEQEVGSVTHDKVTQVQILGTELESIKQEYQTLQNKHAQLEASLMESQEQLSDANTKQMQAQSQHLQEIRELQEHVNNCVPKKQLAQLQMTMAEEEHRAQRLQEELGVQREEAKDLLCAQQKEYERLLKGMEERMEEVEQKLKSVRMMLEEKMNQLKEQFAKNAKSDLLLKDLYVENAQLMKALQITEQRQKGAEKKNYLLDEKIAALNSLLRKIAPASLS
ncbi:ninein-like protein isoform X2 [Rhinoraja longicauda]